MYQWNELLKQFDDLMWLSYAHSQNQTIQDHTFISSKFRLGYPPATQQTIESLEEKLGIPLPTSYKSFLLQTNGWQLFGYGIDNILPVNEVDWFHKNNQDWINLIQEYYPDQHGNIGFFSAKRSTILYRKAINLKNTVLVSSTKDTHVLLMDTSQKQTTPTLEYEIWNIQREQLNICDNFWEAFQEEYASNIAVNDMLKRK
jgi:cell wall assembly regulator SMI1